MSEPQRHPPLLIELLTEELPPKALYQLGQTFAQVIFDQLSHHGLCAEQSEPQMYATPRRLAVLITDVRAQAPDQQCREKLLPVGIALDADGKPAAPLLKKLKSLGIDANENFDLSTLEKVNDGKQEVFYVQFSRRGAQLVGATQTALIAAIEKLPIPKVMTYQRKDGQTVRFVRPAHGLMAIHGEHLLDISALGLASTRTTQGHRFHAELPVTIHAAADYAKVMRQEGKVIVGFEDRRQAIRTELERQAAPHQPIIPEGLLDEVTSLVEWPVVLEGSFDQDFLAVPQECLILTMQQNQKYFALTDSSAKLVNRFLLVSNITSHDPRVVISGNERVLRARLSDAKFFFDQDRKRTLASRVESLASVVYHNKIGSQRERIDRLAQIADAVSTLTGSDPQHAKRAAYIAKADLLTDMVGEFPELQGVIGTYYARHDREPEAVARAIEEHYHPRFAGDSLASSPTGLALALADKLETLIGIWGIGLAPTADKDPFALRRHALGVIRIVMEKNLDCRLDDLLAIGAESFKKVPAVKPDLASIRQFMLDRLRALLKEQQFTAEEIEAVLAQCPDQLNQVFARLKALRRFMLQAEAKPLCSANKRISNILKKTQESDDRVDPSKLTEPAEQSLASMLQKIGPQAEELVRTANYEEALLILSQLKAPVDEFFDKVMVMAEEPAVRANRLALMRRLHGAMNQVADLSKLAA